MDEHHAADMTDDEWPVVHVVNMYWQVNTNLECYVRLVINFTFCLFKKYRIEKNVISND